MPKKTLAQLIEQEVTTPIEESSAITTTQTTPLADLKLTSQGLFDESKALWKQFIEFDQEHQLTQKVGAQLWRLTKAVGKPVLVLTLKGIQVGFVTLTDADKRTELAQRFNRSQPARAADASLSPADDA